MAKVLQKLPYFISHFLGYRKPDQTTKVIPQWRVYFWTFLASWIGIALIEVIFTYSPYFQSQHIPMIIASFGAGAVLVYGVLDAPLAQPRNVICGHVIGSIVGVIIAQLFLTIQKNWASESRRVAVEWIGGATAVSIALAVMQLTKTVHPPGGATALIAVTTPSIVDISWLYIGAVVLSAVVQVIVACFINNIERRYPQYWWTPTKPIKVDPATVITLMPTTTDEDSREKEDVVADTTLTIVEEGHNRKDSETSIVGDLAFYNNKNDTVSSLNNEITKEIQQAMHTLQMHSKYSKVSYSLIIPGLPFITTPGIWNTKEIETLNNLSSAASNTLRSSPID